MRMADSSDSYEWVIYLVVAFFMFVLPLLKKAADVVAGKKKREGTRGRPAGEEDKRGVFGEMLDEVEDYVRKAREGEPAAKPKKQKEIAPFDVWYQERKREIEEKRERREERRRQRRLEALTEAGQPPVQEPELVQAVVHQPALEPSIRTDVRELPVIGEMEEGKILSLTGMDYSDTGTSDVEEDLAEEMLGEMPGVVRAIVLGEILSAAKFAEGMD
jgi:hypothetical protein